MTNKQVLELFSGLQQCGNLQGVKLSYAIAKNLKKLTNIVETIQESINQLQKQHSKKDDEGKPVIVGNQYQMEDLDKFNEDYQTLLAIENDVVLHRIKMNEVPETITVIQMNVLLNIIEEE